MHASIQIAKIIRTLGTKKYRVVQKNLQKIDFICLKNAETFVNLEKFENKDFLNDFQTF